jgi:hypothetical protein
VGKLKVQLSTASSPYNKLKALTHSVLKALTCRIPTVLLLSELTFGRLGVSLRLRHEVKMNAYIERRGYKIVASHPLSPAVGQKKLKVSDGRRFLTYTSGKLP